MLRRLRRRRSSLQPSEKQLQRRAARARAAREDALALKFAVRVQNMFRGRRARREMVAKKASGSGRYVAPPDLGARREGGVELLLRLRLRASAPRPTPWVADRR